MTRSLALHMVALLVAGTIGCGQPTTRPTEKTPPPAPRPNAETTPTGSSTAKEFTSAKGGFAITFPKGSGEVKTMENDTGPAKVLTVSSKLPDETTLQVMVATYPAETLKGIDPEVHLTAVRDQLAKSFRGKVEDDKAVKIDGHPGRTFQIPSAKGSLCRVKAVMAGNRSYQVMVMGPKATATSKEADQFLGSFAIKSK